MFCFHLSTFTFFCFCHLVFVSAAEVTTLRGPHTSCIICHNRGSFKWIIAITLSNTEKSEIIHNKTRNSFIIQMWRKIFQKEIHQKNACFSIQILHKEKWKKNDKAVEKQINEIFMHSWCDLIMDHCVKTFNQKLHFEDKKI